MDPPKRSEGPSASRMVDVGGKEVTERMARASGRITLAPETLAQVRSGKTSKGDPIEVARVAGMMAAKQTHALLPLCHPLPLDSVSLEFSFPNAQTIEVSAEVKATARTGVEMEALTAVSIAALTVYDMCKPMDREIVIEAIRLEEKAGGRSGHYRRKDK